MRGRSWSWAPRAGSARRWPGGCAARGARRGAGGARRGAAGALAAELPGSLAVPADVTDAAALHAAVAAAGPPLAGLAFCVGSIVLKPLERTTEADFLDAFRLNALAAALAVQAAQEALVAAKGARWCCSPPSRRGAGFPNHAAIGAAKAAVEGLTVALAAELAPAVRVNCIAPSLTRTAIAAPLIGQCADGRGDREAAPDPAPGRGRGCRGAGRLPAVGAGGLDHRPGDRRGWRAGAPSGRAADRDAAAALLLPAALALPGRGGATATIAFRVKRRGDVVGTHLRALRRARARQRVATSELRHRAARRSASPSSATSTATRKLTPGARCPARTSRLNRNGRIIEMRGEAVAGAVLLEGTGGRAAPARRCRAADLVGRRAHRAGACRCSAPPRGAPLALTWQSRRAAGGGSARPARGDGPRPSTYDAARPLGRLRRHAARTAPHRLRTGMSGGTLRVVLGDQCSRGAVGAGRPRSRARRGADGGGAGANAPMCRTIRRRSCWCSRRCGISRARWRRAACAVDHVRLDDPANTQTLRGRGGARRGAAPPGAHRRDASRRMARAAGHAGLGSGDRPAGRDPRR